MIAITVVFSRISDMTPSAFKIPFASQWAFSGYAILVSLIVPESPVHLVTKEKIPQAQKCLKMLGTANIDERIAIIRATAEQEAMSFNEEASISECFQGANLRRTRIVALLNILQQFMGVSLVANSTYFFIMAGMDPTMSLTMNQIGVGCSMACTLVSWVILAKVGRRLAILVSFAAAGIIFLGMGIAGFWPQNSSALRYTPTPILLRPMNCS